MQRIVKPKTQQAKRILENRAPKLVENPKNCMFIKGGNTNLLVAQTLKELYLLKKPNAVMFKKKNIVRPFEDTSSLEFFSNRADCSQFVFGSHSKKRPNNCVFGRMYDYHVLDMVEFGVDKFVSLEEFKAEKIPMGTMPILTFCGELFDNDSTWIRVKNLLIDLFGHSGIAKKVRLNGLEHVLMFSTAANDKLFVRSYRVHMKKCGGSAGPSAPGIQLEEMGPSLDMTLRRTQLASDSHFKLATRRPKALMPKKKKNMGVDAFGTKLGRIHMQKQDVNKLQLRKVKALKVAGKKSDGPRRTKRKTDGGDSSLSRKKIPKHD